MKLLTATNEYLTCEFCGHKATKEWEVVYNHIGGQDYVPTCLDGEACEKRREAKEPAVEVTI